MSYSIATTKLLNIVIVLVAISLSTTCGSVTAAADMDYSGSPYKGMMRIYTTCIGINFRTISIFDAKYASQTLRRTYNTIMFQSPKIKVRHEKIRQLDFYGVSLYDYSTHGHWLISVPKYKNSIGYFHGEWYNKHGNSTDVHYRETAIHNFDDDIPPTSPPEYYALLHTEWEETFVVLLRSSNRTAFQNVKSCSFNYEIYTRYGE